MIGGKLAELGGIQNAAVGMIVGQYNEKKGKIDHVGIIVMHDFEDGHGEVKTLYQSRGEILGGPEYFQLSTVTSLAWTDWMWHDGLTR